MANYTCSQLAQLWVQAGGAASLANQMASVAMAESSGNPNASNSNTNGTIDRGLWQINSIWGSGSTFDPLANAQAAVKVYGEQGLGAWSSSQSRWGSNPACGTAPGPVSQGAVSTMAATGPQNPYPHPPGLFMPVPGAQGSSTGGGGISLGCAHSLQLQILSGDQCMDGPIGALAALGGIVAVLVGIAVLFGLPQWAARQATPIAGLAARAAVFA